jgi:hypothetical protein
MTHNHDARDAALLVAFETAAGRCRMILRHTAPATHTTGAADLTYSRRRSTVRNSRSLR